MKRYLIKIYFLLNLGPTLPLLKALSKFSMLEIHGDAFIFGGYDGFYNSAIHQLTCSSGICSWSTLNQDLKVGRRSTLAIPVPDIFCLEEGEGTTTTTSTTGIILLENQVAADIFG